MRFHCLSFCGCHIIGLVWLWFLYNGAGIGWAGFGSRVLSRHGDASGIAPLAEGLAAFEVDCAVFPEAGRAGGAGAPVGLVVKSSAIVRRATCDVRRAACGVRRATCDVRRAACGVRRAACGVR